GVVAPRWWRIVLQTSHLRGPAGGTTARSVRPRGTVARPHPTSISVGAHRSESRLTDQHLGSGIWENTRDPDAWICVVAAGVVAIRDNDPRPAQPTVRVSSRARDH